MWITKNYTFPNAGTEAQCRVLIMWGTGFHVPCYNQTPPKPSKILSGMKRIKQETRYVHSTVACIIKIPMTQALSVLYSILCISGMMHCLHINFSHRFLFAMWLKIHLSFYYPSPWDSLCSPRAGPDWLWTLRFPASAAGVLWLTVHTMLSSVPPPFQKINSCVCRCGTCEFACTLRSERDTKSHLLLSLS